MKVCTFFGHRDAPCTIEPQLHETLRYLVSKKHVDTFYVGNQGQFDHMVQHHLQMLTSDFPHIRCFIILHQLPTTTASPQSSLPSLFPEGLEYVHPKYALVHRNRWMVQQADVIVAYVLHDWGGAAQFTAYARHQGKPVFNLAEKSISETISG